MVHLIVSGDLPAIFFLPPSMPQPTDFEDLRELLHRRHIDHAWLRTVLHQYLESNPQTDSDDIHHDHQVWDYRNTVEEFAKLLNDDPDELDDDERED